MYGRNATYPTSTKESTMNFTDKITLVTGGASGIGRATVTKFAQLGATVIFTDINDVNGPAFEKELVEAGHKARFVRSEEHTSELQSLMRISYAVFCLKNKINNQSH